MNWIDFKKHKPSYERWYLILYGTSHWIKAFWNGKSFQENSNDSGTGFGPGHGYNDPLYWMYVELPT